MANEHTHESHAHHDHGAKRARNLSHIQGWGADLDLKNRPGYPMERTPPRLEGVHGEQPEQQPVNITVFHSTERPHITPIFGTSAPPKGLSGKIRALAFRLAENDIRHWLLLLFADRINVIEGIGEDLKNGHIPNVFSEMGINAEWQHNRAGLVRKAVVVSAIAGIAYYLLKKNHPR